MDISLLSKNSLRLKIKKTTLIIDPNSSIAKIEADAVIAISKDIDESRVNDARVLLNGAGEYEVNGLKISATGTNEDLLFSFSLDEIGIALVKASVLSKISQDKIKDYEVVIVNADTDISQSVITSMEPRVIVLYGEKAMEAAKNLGKEDPVAVSKLSVSEDKLPEETEIYLLS